MNLLERPPIKYSPYHKDFQRLKYYQRLRDSFQNLDNSFHRAPFHVIDGTLLMTPFDIYGFDKGKKHGSLTMIFSVWNSLVGASLVTLPWAFSLAGIGLGTLICLLCFLINFYTTYLVINLTGRDSDFTDTLYRHFGKSGWILGSLIGIIMLLVPITVFFQLIC